MAQNNESKTLDECDVQIIAALALGMTQENAGAWVITPEHPQGVSGRTVRNRIAEKQAVYDRVRQRIASAFAQKQETFEQFTREQLKAEHEKLRSKRFKVQEVALDQALANPTIPEVLKLGVSVANTLDDRDLGKPSQVHKHEGDVNVNHRIWGQPQPARLLAQQERDSDESQALLAGLPSDVLEAEVVSN